MDTKYKNSMNVRLANTFLNGLVTRIFDKYASDKAADQRKRLKFRD
jgi:hypothetical protein